MSVTIDTNVLVYASNTDCREHLRAADVVQGMLTGPGLTTVFWPVLTSYLRIITSAIVPEPLTSAEAHANIDAVLSSPSVRVVGEGENFWRCYKQIGGGRGNAVPDAVIVALMLEHGVGTILSRDRDFRKYPEIRVRDPFAN